MIAISTLNVILFFLGTLIGLYLPAVVMFLWIRWQSNTTTREKAGYLAKRISLSILGLFAIFGFLGFFLDEVLGFGSKPVPEENVFWLGLGVLSGLALGIWIALLALRRRKRGQESRK